MTLEEAVKRSESEYHDYPDIIDSSAGLSKIDEINVMGIQSWDRLNKGKKRKIVLSIRTFRGISSGATHFYGKLTVDGVYTGNADNLEECVTLTFDQLRKYPLHEYHYNFIVKRPLTQLEINSKPDRWYGYDINHMVDGFDTVKELIDSTTDIVKLRFTGEWNFIVQYPNGKKEEINL